jgi:transposase
MELSDAHWVLLEPLIPQPVVRPDRRGRPWKPARLVLDAVLWVLRTGAPWRDLPDCYPAYQTCHRRFQLWIADGTFRRVVSRLAEVLGVGAGGEAFIDGSYVPARRAGEHVGRCRAGRATKIMALADSHGMPMSVAIAPGNRHDVVLTDLTLDASFVDALPEKLIGDKAWDSAKLQDVLASERGIELIAPKRGGARPSRRRQDGRALRRLRRRWKVERLFAWLKGFRRLATRWEHKSDNYLGLLYLGCIVILLRQC